MKEKNTDDVTGRCTNGVVPCHARFMVQYFIASVKGVAACTERSECMAHIKVSANIIILCLNVS